MPNLFILTTPGTSLQRTGSRLPVARCSTTTRASLQGMRSSSCVGQCSSGCLLQWKFKKVGTDVIVISLYLDFSKPTHMDQ